MSEITLTRDELDAPVSMETVVNDRDFEILGDYPWLSWLRRVTGNQRLFCMRALGAGTFVLAVWVYAPGEGSVRICTELESFTAPPTSLWPEDLMHPEVIIHRLQPWKDHYADLRRKYADKMRREEEIRRLSHEDRQDVASYLRRRGMEEQAHQLASGQVEFTSRAENPEAVDEMADMMKGIARHL